MGHQCVLLALGFRHSTQQGGCGCLFANHTEQSRTTANFQRGHQSRVIGFFAGEQVAVVGDAIGFRGDLVEFLASVALVFLPQAHQVKPLATRKLLPRRAVESLGIEALVAKLLGLLKHIGFEFVTGEIVQS